ncbi:FliA/WhiG family RNA polymerase sigma factor [bacterium]|nr:FliA/WhiG family RNA polymerase sigma factor [bacterium]
MKTEQLAHQDLWDRVAQNGDWDARQALVEKYARVVKYVAGRMAIGLPHYVDQNDLVSAGLLGLIQAVDNFDCERGIKFETYAIPRIRGAILDELRSQDWFPRSLRRKARQLEEAYVSLETKLGRPATDEELAKELNVSRDELLTMIEEVSVATIISLDAESGGEGDDTTTLGEYLPDPKADDIEERVTGKEMVKLIADGLEELPEKEQLVLVLYYYEDLTLKEIGSILDVTESRVCQIHTKAIMRLRGKLKQPAGKRSIDRLTKEIRQSRKRGDQETIVESMDLLAGFAIPSMLVLARLLLEHGVPLFSGPIT